MDNILLIISEWSLRQLYHELLLSKHIEVTPVAAIENATVMLTLNHFSAAILYSDEQNIIDIKTFLQLRRQHKGLSKTKIILLTEVFSPNLFSNLLLKTDSVLEVDYLQPVEVVEYLKRVL